MARIHRSDNLDAAPRPIGQSFWLLSAVVFAAIILGSMGDVLAASPTTAAPLYDRDELLLLADRSMARGGLAIIDEEAPGDPVALDPVALDAVALQSDRFAAPTGPGARAAGTTEDAVRPSSTPLDHRARGKLALADISYPWQALLPGWTIEFLPERSGLYGLTKVPDKRIEIYVREGQSQRLLAHVIAHELGHAVDVTLNAGSDRRRWEESRGLRDQPWWPGSGATDFSTGAGDFAESFAAWQVGDQSFRSNLADAPTDEQIDLLAELSAS